LVPVSGAQRLDDRQPGFDASDRAVLTPLIAGPPGPTGRKVCPDE
jgi:hypothetical protein